MQKSQQIFDIKHYIAIILRRKYVALSVGLAVISLFTWGSFLMPKKYKATTTVSIEKSSVLQPLIQGIGVSEHMEDRLKNLKRELTSRNVIEKVIKKLGLDADIKNPEQYEALIEGMRKKLDLLVAGAPNYFEISYIGDDPKKVADIVNGVANTYIEDYVYSKRTDVSDAYEFIQGQLLEYKKRLEDSDKAIREFRERHPNLIPQSETSLLSRIERLEDSKKEAQIRLRELMSMQASLKQQLANEKEFSVAFITKEVSSEDPRLIALNNKLKQLMLKYTENYPEVIRVKNEIEELKKQLKENRDPGSEGTSSETVAINPVYQNLKETKAQVDSEIESLKARISELSRQQGEIKAILGRIPKEQEEWTKLQRDRNVHQQIYDQLLQKLENARVSKNIEFTEKGETFRVVDPAKVPLTPFKPNRVKMILLGIFLGIASGIGAVLGLEYFDHSFKDVETIEAILELPVLSTIPKIVTEDDELSAKRLDKKVLIASGAYLSIIGAVFIVEFLARYMGIKIIPF